MRGLNLTNNQRIHNSGEDLWNYMFHGQPLKNVDFEDEDPESDGNDVIDDGIEWLEKQLLEGEEYAQLPDHSHYAITTYARFANLKKKTWKARTIQGETISASHSYGAISLSKFIREFWDIEIIYDDLPKESKEGMSAGNASKRLAEKYGFRLYNKKRM